MVLKDTNNYHKIGIKLFNIGMFLLLLLLFINLFFFSNYVHEAGHITFGFLNSVLRGNVTNFAVTNWIEHPILKFIKLPQQTIGNGSFNFIFGGSIFSLLVFFFISWIGWKYSGRKTWFLIFASMFIFEFFGNFLCGTDNWNGGHLVDICSSLKVGLIGEWIGVLLFSGSLSYLVIKSNKYKKVAEGFFRGKSIKRGASLNNNDK